jgi:hypothetical protein
MTFCPVTADLNRHLARIDAEEAQAERVDEKLEAMMQDRSAVAAIVDDILQLDPYTDIADNGSTRLADWLAEIIVAGTGTQTGEQLMTALIEQIEGHTKVRMRLDAETAVAKKDEQDARDAADMRAGL